MPDKPPDNMALWNARRTTDPQFVKRVNSRGGFSAIAAQWQLMQATEQWGPYGSTWGVKDCSYDIIASGENLVGLALEATFYYPNGEFEIATDMAYKPGNDCYKKALTDLTTKALSKLGFSADVFLGEFDDDAKYGDNKYVNDTDKQGRPRASAGKKDGNGEATNDLDDLGI